MTDGTETWCTTPRTRVLPILFKDDPVLTFKLLHKGNIWFLVHCYREMPVYSISLNYWRLVYKVSWMSTWTHLCTRCQDPSSTFFQGHSDIITLNTSSSKGPGPIETKFYLTPLWIKGTHLCQNYWGHVTKMAVMLLFVENKYLKTVPELNSWWYSPSILAFN